jgi:putative alpha-1,2-mannosidase
MDTKAFLDMATCRTWIGRDFVTDSTGSHFSASHTLEYSFSAFATAQMAKAMGKTG